MTLAEAKKKCKGAFMKEKGYLADSNCHMVFFSELVAHPSIYMYVDETLYHLPDSLADELRLAINGEVSTIPSEITTFKYTNQTNGQKADVFKIPMKFLYNVEGTKWVQPESTEPPVTESEISVPVFDVPITDPQKEALEASESPSKVILDKLYKIDYKGLLAQMKLMSDDPAALIMANMQGMTVAGADVNNIINDSVKLITNLLLLTEIQNEDSK